MINTNWSELKLNRTQLGMFGECYAKMEFISHKYEVYTSFVDDHGVDFVAKNPNTGEFFEVQVKGVLKSNYIYIRKDKLYPHENKLVCVLIFVDGEPPKMYIIPATAWKSPNSLLASYAYDKKGQKSKPEWGIRLSKRNESLLEEYHAEKFFEKHSL